jgi:hypothetical protein
MISTDLTYTDYLYSLGFNQISTLDEFRDYFHLHNRTWPFASFKYCTGEEEHAKIWYDDELNRREGDFSYETNELGFYSGPLLTDADICYYGCSFTTAVGVSRKSRWSTLVDAEFGYQSNNFAMTGVSIEEILRCFAASTKFVRMKTAVFLLPDMHRYTMPVVTSNDHTVNYCNLFTNYQNSSYYDVLPKLKTAYQTICKTYYELPDEYFIDRFKNTIQMICYIARLHGIKIYLASWDFSDERVKILAATNEHIIPSILFDRKGRDGLHPGISAHRQFADDVISAIRLDKS